MLYEIRILIPSEYVCFVKSALVFLGNAFKTKTLQEYFDVLKT